jgi:hypothetical protein
MSLRMTIATGAAAVGLIMGVGCNISTCEEGSDCDGDWDKDHENVAEETEKCTVYCGRVSVCGGHQAGDFDGCVSSCEKRFEALPDETARICACAEWSSCSDVNEGRCSEEPSGSGGSASCPGGCNTGSGGSSSSAGSSSGGTASSGGAASGGSGAGGEAGANPGIPCTGDCDCAGGTICIAGYCTAP